LKAEDVKLRRASAGCLAAFAAHVKEALPALTIARRDADFIVRRRSSFAVMLITRETETLLADVQNEDARLELIAAWESAGWQSLATVKLARKADNEHVRRAAAGVMGVLACPSWGAIQPYPVNEIVPLLIEMLQDKETAVVRSALHSLINASTGWANLNDPSTQDAVTAISRCLKHEDADVRYWAALRLRDFRTRAIAAMPALREAWHDDADGRVRDAAQATLSYLHRISTPWTPQRRSRLVPLLPPVSPLSPLDGTR